MALPKRACPKAESDEPAREKLRTDNLAMQLAVQLDVVLQLAELAVVQLAVQLAADVEPRWKKSNVATAEPTRANDRSENVDLPSRCSLQIFSEVRKCNGAFHEVSCIFGVDQDALACAEHA